MSPAGGHLALRTRDQQRDIWIADLARPQMTRLTTNPAEESLPTWTQGGTHIAYVSGESVYEQPADGTGVS